MPQCPQKKSSKGSNSISPLGWRCYNDTGELTCYPKNYYYDEKGDTCKPFDFNGCGASGNNFESVEDCMAHCRKATPDLRGGRPSTNWTATLLKKIPKCEDMKFDKTKDNGTITRFFYNSRYQTCKKVYVREGDLYFPAFRYCVKMCNATVTTLKRCGKPLKEGSFPVGWNCTKTKFGRECKPIRQEVSASSH